MHATEKLLALFLLLALSSPMFAVQYDMRDAAMRNVVVAVSEAPFERTVAVTHFLSGMLELDPDNLSSGIKGQFVVDLRTLDFGAELKNIQVREQFLNTKQFPEATATFQAKGMGKLVDGKSTMLKVDADTTVRGITKKLSVALELTYFKETELTKLRLPGNLVRVRSHFVLDTLQFGITLADNLLRFFNPKLDVNVEIFGSDRIPTDFRGIPEGPKKK